MQKTNFLKKIAAIAIMSGFIFSLAASPGIAAPAVTTNYDRPVVMIDVAKAGTGSFNNADLYKHLAEMLVVWGFDVMWNTANFTAGDLDTVDILVVPQANFNYTAGELTVISDWFDTGNKGLWVAGDSDFGGNAGWAYRANQVLHSVESNVTVESGAVESDINFGGGTYRVSGVKYNTMDVNSEYITAGLPYQGDDAMALFHGPTSVIGWNGTDYMDLETNSLTNVEWVVQATNGTFLPNTVAADAEGAQVHGNNDEGNFTLMALQHSAGAGNTGKIVVSGSHIFSTYKEQFHDPAEFGVPHNDFYLVYKTFQWFLTDVTTDLPVVMIDVAKAGTGSFNNADLYSHLADQLKHWGFDVIWNTDNFTAGDLDTVDILVVPQANFNYTAGELTVISDWFDTGNKGLWVAGDSDFGGNAGWAYRANQVLHSVESNVTVESGAVESDINFGGGTYRVSGVKYNTMDSNAAMLTDGLPYQGDDAMALFHGPTSVIGWNGTDYMDLETNSLTNVEWVVQATNGTFLPNTVAADAEGAQVHGNNDEGNFTLMALQHSAGAGNTGKIVVSGSHIFSTYKEQFHDPAEFGVPHNDFYLVYNTFHWFIDSMELDNVVMIDVAKAGTGSFNNADLYSHFAQSLREWGYRVVWNTNNFTAGDLDGVDILFVPQANFNYTAGELTVISDWFDTGYKGLWVAGDSDFGGNAGWAYRANQVLHSVESNITVESGAVESDINFGGGTYRVSATKYNTMDSNAAMLTTHLPNQGEDANALFHGPTAVIGWNGTDYMDLETNSLTNVEWVVQATNGTFLPNTVAADAEGAQVHGNNDEGNFTMMALQHSAGAGNTGKIVVTGSHIFSSYKEQFSPVGEFDVHHNDYYIVRNAMQWMAPVLTTPVMSYVDITAPDYNYEVAGPFTLEWSASEFHAASYEFDVMVDGSVEGTTTGYSFELDLESGTHDIVIKATTWDGFVSYSSTHVVVVDNDAPEVSLTSTVTNGSTITVDSASVDYDISDAGVGLDTFSVMVNGAAYATGTSANATGTLSWSDLANGAYTVSVTATDTLGNEMTVIYEFTVDVPVSSSSSSTTSSTGTGTSQSSSSSGGGTGSPGFELLAVMIGIGAIIALRRRK